MILRLLQFGRIDKLLVTVTTLCDQICRRFSPDTLDFLHTNNTDRHDITEILLKVTLTTNCDNNYSQVNIAIVLMKT